MRRLLLALLLLVAAALPAAAQQARDHGTPPGVPDPATVGPVPELTAEQARTANEAMALLRSPVTASHTVDMCPSVPELRDAIRVAAYNGMTRDAIVEDVVARYGERVRLLPKKGGAGLLAWVATPLVMLLGAGLIFLRLRRGSEQAAAVARVAPLPLSGAEHDKVAAALREYELSAEEEE